MVTVYCYQSFHIWCLYELLSCVYFGLHLLLDGTIMTVAIKVSMRFDTDWCTPYKDIDGAVQNFKTC